MNLLPKLSIVLFLLVSFNILSQETNHDKIISEHANIYGQLSIYFGTFRGVNERCKTNLIPQSMAGQVDFLFKKIPNIIF